MFVARTGGEEFALIVEGASEDATHGDRRAHPRRRSSRRSSAAARPATIYGTVTISMGICMASEADGPEDLYAKADRALYRSKVSGRNRVTAHSRAARDRPARTGCSTRRTDRPRQRVPASRCAQPLTTLLARLHVALLQQFRHQERQFERLVGVEARVAMRVVAVLQILVA